jgi:Tfp pilus assembly protein FimT
VEIKARTMDKRAPFFTASAASKDALPRGRKKNGGGQSTTHQNGETRVVKIESFPDGLWGPRRRCRVTNYHSANRHRTGLANDAAGDRPGYSQEDRWDLRKTGAAFTVIEILIVVAIVVVAAMMIIPLASSGASMQIGSAANMIAADLEYAKSMAISRQKFYAVVFDVSADSYQIEDPNGIINHPVKKGFPYVVNFSNESRLSKVSIAGAAFNGTNTVKFGYLGSPYDGGNNPLNSGVITLQAAAITVTINVEPVTGYVSISD